MPQLFEVSLAEQVSCIEREIAMRERVYPRWVSIGKMTARKAEFEMDAIKAVLETLKSAGARYAHRL